MSRAPGNDARQGRWVAALLARERRGLVSRLLGGVVHNLSGAFQMIQMPVDLLERSLLEGRVEEACLRIASTRQGIDRLLKELHLLTAYANHSSDAALREFDPAVVVRGMLDFWVGDLFFKHEVALKVELPGGEARVRGVVADLGVALNALIENALESLQSTGGTRLEIRLGVEPEWAELWVRDEGPGPAAEMQPRMFDPFEGDKGGEHEGLGLFLAREALRPWGGEVGYRQGPAGGFFLRLPRVGPEAKGSS